LAYLDFLFPEFAHEVFAVRDLLAELLPACGEKEDIVFEGDGASHQISILHAYNYQVGIK
jgi:hypothetical protein